MIPSPRSCYSFLFVLGALHRVCAITLQVSTSGGNASSPLLYGLMFEDINHSGDGGIHGQLLQNNGFQGTKPNISAYDNLGNVNITQDSSTPLSDAIKSSLKVEVLTGTTGKVGFLNHGYNGVPVNKDTYSTAFYVKGKYTGEMTISLQGKTGTSYGSTSIQVNSNADSFTYYEAKIDATASPDGSNSWQLRFDSEKVTGNALWFDLIQLFPSTYHSRKNGLRPDIADFVADMNPSFLRFPGGNNLEGGSIDTRWKWNETIGPLKNRPGRQGTWQYPNTDALGLMEYMYWVQDMNMKPVLNVFAGAGLGEAPTATGDALEPYIQEVMDELEFLMGDASTPNGALRAKYGQQSPFQIDMVEIGNEDFISNSLCTSYATRFTDIYNAIHAKYPNMRIIASTDDPKCLPKSLPQSVWADKHHYERPEDFVKLFNEWDNTPRSNDYGIFVGEFAVHKRNDGSVPLYPEMQGSISEAVYWIGLERNSDLVKMAAYAPLLEHSGLSQWTVSVSPPSSSAHPRRIALTFLAASRTRSSSTPAPAPSPAAPRTTCRSSSPPTAAPPSCPSPPTAASGRCTGSRPPGRDPRRLTSSRWPTTGRRSRPSRCKYPARAARPRWRACRAAAPTRTSQAVPRSASRAAPWPRVATATPLPCRRGPRPSWSCRRRAARRPAGARPETHPLGLHRMEAHRMAAHRMEGLLRPVGHPRQTPRPETLPPLAPRQKTRARPGTVAETDVGVVSPPELLCERDRICVGAWDRWLLT